MTEEEVVSRSELGLGLFVVGKLGRDWLLVAPSKWPPCCLGSLLEH